MRNSLKRGVVLVAALGLVASACGDDDGDTSEPADSVDEPGDDSADTTDAADGDGDGDGASAGGKVGFILPDSASSARWEDFDRPLIEAACEDAGIECLIQNAEGDKDNMATIADQMIADGIGVLAIVNLDSESGAAIQEKAAAAGVKNIDYDRLTLGGSADVYVSFDNVAVGTTQGEGLIECFGGDTEGKRIIQLHGSPTDNNATLFRQGYQTAIEGAGFETVGEEAVPDWDNAQGGVIFEQLLTAAGGEVDGVLVANDGLSLAAQAVLADNGLTLPTTGQDATVDGLRAILQGTQCMTVYKPVVVEAEAAVAAAVALLNGEAPDTDATIDNENGEIPFVQGEVQGIFLDNINVPIDDGFVSAADVCAGLEDLCAEAGISVDGSSGDGDGDGDGASAGGKVGFILPDSASSARWEDFDRPLIEAACEDAGIECLIQNAEGDKDNMATIADQMIADGIGVLAIVNLDSESGAAIQEKAAAAGVKNIDYDRLTLGGSADVYVSFDNVAVGTTQGEGLIECFGGDTEGKRIIQLHGSPTDNNATLFRQGYQTAIEGAGFETVGEEAVPDWDNAQGGVIFEQLLTAAGGEVDGVLVANDGLSLAAQAVLADNGLTLPTTGQDATVDGLRAILQGTQCMTVYKPVVVEAEAAVAAAVALLNGEAPDTDATIDNENGEIPFVQGEVQGIFLDNINVPIDDGFVSRDDVCADIEDACEAAGI